MSDRLGTVRGVLLGAVVVTAAGNLTAGNDLVAEYGRSGPQGVTPVGQKSVADGQDTPFWRSIVLDPAAARASGWMVRRASDPAAVALVLWDGRTVRLDVDGGYDVCWDTTAAAAASEVAQTLPR